jgi:hypothetical protein
LSLALSLETRPRRGSRYRGSAAAATDARPAETRSAATTADASAAETCSAATATDMPTTSASAMAATAARMRSSAAATAATAFILSCVGRARERGRQSNDGTDFEF